MVISLGGVHLLNTSRTPAAAASFSAADPPNRVFQVVTYFMVASFAKDPPWPTSRIVPAHAEDVNSLRRPKAGAWPMHSRTAPNIRPGQRPRIWPASRDLAPRRQTVNAK